MLRVAAVALVIFHYVHEEHGGRVIHVQDPLHRPSCFEEAGGLVAALKDAALGDEVFESFNVSSTFLG